MAYKTLTIEMTALLAPADSTRCPMIMQEAYDGVIVNITGKGWLAYEDGSYRERPNAWRISRAATIDRYCVPVDSNVQNWPDLVDAQRRRAACAGWAGGPARSFICKESVFPVSLL
jgi:hypothetical protein